MIQTITIKTSDLGTDYTFGSLNLSTQVKNMGRFYGIPEALHNVDRKFGTNTFREVLQAATKELNVLHDDNTGGIQLLDPRSVYLDDDKFDQLISSIQGDPQVSSTKFQKQAIYKIKPSDTDNFVGDVFGKQLVVTRKAEGGISVNTELMRQVCSNGLVLPDKQFSQTMRKPSKLTAELFSAYFDAAEAFNVDEYLSALFNNDGNPVQASLADVYKMKDCLIDVTEDTDFADMLFQTARMEEFYKSQGINVAELSRQYLDKLPSGLTYYQALNILTSGAKVEASPSIDNKIKVASFCTPQKMKSLKNVADLQFSGMPTFSNAEIHLWMGDGHKSAQEVINSVKA